MKLMKKIAACAMAAAMFVTAGSTVFAASTTVTKYGSYGYTSILTGPKMKLTCTAKTGERAKGTLYIKDPYLWHNWGHVYIDTTGKRTDSIYKSDGSSKAKWKGFAENARVTIANY